MKLIGEITALLCGTDGSLAGALLKTKVLMHQIGHKELTEWVNNELNGYPREATLPHYRIVPSRVIGHVANAAYVQKSMVLPTMHLPERIQNDWHNCELREPVGVLETFARSKPDEHLKMPLSPEFHHLVNKALGGGYAVQKMWLQIEPTQALHAVTQIRSRLLDFVLELQEELGDVTEGEVKEAAKGIDAQSLFRDAVFGDNTTVVIGSGNTTNVSNVRGSDFESLARVLREGGVAQSDINELKVAIAADAGQVVRETKTFGPSVRGWISKMMDKAVNAAWQIELGVAGGLLTNALQAYYFS